MIKIVYIFLIFFASILLQIEVGSTGFVIPFIVMAVCYLTIIFSWRSVIIPSLIAGVIIDLLYGRDPYFSAPLLLLILLISILWLYKGNTKSISIQILPGFLIALVYIYPSFFIPYHEHEHGFLQTLEKIGFFIGSLILSSVIFPYFVYILDRISKAFGIPIYSKAKERISKK